MNVPISILAGWLIDGTGRPVQPNVCLRIEAGLITGITGQRHNPDNDFQTDRTSTKNNGPAGNKDLKDSVLVIHTKNNGEISEAQSGKAKDVLESLRKQANEIDDADNPYKAIVSVMMLKEKP